MLELKNITKIYRMGDIDIPALNGISLAFRENEFVSVLGPSGCGKTTLLNIIGGLDRSTSGDMRFLGKSTKAFMDRDWDSYRNHRIGFVFQSYNLIPHQTILSNVELSLSIAGVGKKERVRKAKEALDKVGLNGLYYKKPNQLSGGQSQRVAIARALVNDPEILLADEPTGSLDSATSEQIMALIKEIARTKLVIMVTHNADIANRYSTRIITMKDGLILNDSNPYAGQPAATPAAAKQARGKKNRRVKMSFFDAFRLSLKNLFSKKARTIMTGIAGSIGIVGISVVLALSYGIQSYIQSMQNDMLSGFPITVSRSTLDINAMLQNARPDEQKEIIVENGYVNVRSMLDYVVSRSTDTDFRIENNITKEYLAFLNEMPEEYYNQIFYDYGLDLSTAVYTGFSTEGSGGEDKISLTTIKAIYMDLLGLAGLENSSGYISGLDDVFMQSFSNAEYLLSQYDVLYGDIAAGKGEIMLVLNKDHQLSDLLLAQLGYYTQEEFLNIVYKSLDDEKYDETLDKEKFSYAELAGKSFTWYPNDTVFTKVTDPYLKELTPFIHNAYSGGAFSGGIELEISGILTPKENINYGVLESGIYYTEELAQYIMQTNRNSEIAEFLSAEPGNSVTSLKYNNTYTGITFKYSYTHDGTEYPDQTGLVGKTSATNMFFGGGATANLFVLTLQQIGGEDLPSEISLYPKDFDTKNEVLEYLDKWNSDETIIVNGAATAPENRDKITYTDNLSLIIKMVSTFVDIVTYALVGFTALSLLVSSVMIGIITYISVVERTNEIGVIRSLGGHKIDVANLFNAETFLIGLTSGLIGIGVTYLIIAALNAVIAPLANIVAIAILPVGYAAVMTAISVALTLLAGIVPSMSAAKKDPVVALRTI